MRAMVVACAVLACASSAPAQDDAVAHWQALTRGDVEAAYQLLLEDHPALSRTINDTAFRARLEAGRELALQRAAQVNSLEGYAATMAGLALVANDKHVRSRTPDLPATVRWAGLIISRRGDRFVVSAHEGAAEGASLVGAALVSCDGVSADDFAAAKLGGFRAVWSVNAQRIQSAPYLLIDDGNPFVLRPTACVFERNGEQIEHALAWREVARTDLRQHVVAALNRGAPGFGVREFPGGIWIALQSLDGEEAAAVVAAVRENQARLRAAPLVVLDMRGNGGGNSQFGNQIAQVLFGEARVRHLIRGGGDCSVVWRISPRNLAQMRSYLTRFEQTNPEFADMMRGAVARAEQAEREGRDLSGPATCAGGRAASGPPPRQAAAGNIVLLTDNACFSSCLIVTDVFRRLGALHVGQATDAATHYFEVRDELLPSGLSFFSTLQAFSPASPAELGPFTPEIAYDGDMTDTAALEAWVRTVAGGARP